MANFDFLLSCPEYRLFSAAAVEAEKVYHTSPAMCAIGCRKALELAVKWVYTAENLELPYQDNLQALIHNPDFYRLPDKMTWSRMPYIIKLGNLAVHSEKSIEAGEARMSLENLFGFIDWIDYTYGKDYPVVPRTFLDSELPTSGVIVDVKRVKEQESLLIENKNQIERLKQELAEKTEELAKAKEDNRKNRPEYVTPEQLSEFETRKRYIDLDLKSAGWQFDDSEVVEEYPVDNMAGVPGKGNGFADYVLFGRDGKPLAIVEAKKTTVNVMNGKTQAGFYADSLEQKFGVRPMIFLSNGFSIYFWDNLTGPERKVGGFFSRSDLERLMIHRNDLKELDQVPINQKITGRPYQIEAIRAVCEHVKQRFRKNLLVMATGTGKTRTAASIVDVLARGNYVTNVLFLADRTALVKQARDAFKTYLPDMSLCNLLEGKEDKDARIVFSTYPTILNAIDNARTKDGQPLYSPAHFDLIIIDESHRSIFKKYKAIFDYFDAILVGLTATPKTDVDKNTYEFFECEDGIPTSAYDYETAVERDHVLVPFYNIEVQTNFIDNGIHYDDLSEEDKRKYEEYFTEDDGTMPEYIDSKEINRLVFNKDTVDMVLQDLMRNGIKVAGGDRIAKTIIFAQNRRHADYIVERFNALYPMYGGTFCRTIVCEDAYAQSLIDLFRTPAPPSQWAAELETEPQIAVSVDMMDTGIDVPHIGNLVFFKKVYSKTKFWQMIGRGTRLCPEMVCVDGQNGEYTGKKYFYIFDYCGNFNFFREQPNGLKGADALSLSQAMFIKKAKIIAKLQDEEYQQDDLIAFRKKLIADCYGQIAALNPELTIVRMYRESVEMFRDISAFDTLDDKKLNELTKTISTIVTVDDSDEYAKRYDNTILSMMLDALDGGKDLRKASGKLTKISTQLSHKGTIKQVSDKIDLIKQTSTDEYWVNASITDYEHVREELRDLIKFLSDDDGKPIVFSNLDDTEIGRKEGEPVPTGDEFSDYKARVNQYVNENGNTLVIYKLTHNQPLTESDYSQLEHILTSELGSKEDYQKAFKDTPFGLLVRKIAGMDHEAVMSTFAEFIESEHLNTRQINFMNKVIAYVEKNGYISSSDLLKPPFDKPASFLDLFTEIQQRHLINTLKGVRDNAEHATA